MTSAAAESHVSLDKRGERIRGMFAEIAPRYDLLNRLLSLRIDLSWRKRVVELAPPDAGGRPILDVCTGTGDLAFAYASRFPMVSVLGVDFCPPMLELAKHKATRRKLNVDFRDGDALALDFPDDAFQIVTIAFGLRNLADADRGLRELTRVTAPGGRVVVLEFSQPKGRWLRPFFNVYFRRLLPWLGQKLAPNREGAYHYLPASIAEFDDGERFVQRMEAAGLCHAAAHRLTFGVATIYIGRKPSAPAPATPAGRSSSTA